MFLVQIVLARILEPVQFGLVAMVSVFVVISAAVAESGLGTALVQRKEASDSDRSSVFWFNLLISMLMMGGLWLVAPLIARFYAQPSLTDILRVLSLVLVISAAGSVHASLLNRELQFRKLFWVTTPSTVISGVIGIALALQGFGVWALVGQTLSQAICRTSVLWLQTGWRPSAVCKWASLRSLLPYGSRLAVSGILDRGFQNLYVLIIGRVFSPIEVGFFQRAFALQQFPVTNLNSVVGSVAFPLLSRLQHEPSRMQKAVATSLQMTSLLSFTCMGMLAALARPLVTVLLGDKWLPCVPMLQLLCIAGALYPIHATNLCLLQALGRSDLFLRLEIIKKGLTLASLLLTWRFGILVMIYGMVANSIISLIVNTYYTRKFIDYGVGAQLRDILPILGLSGAHYAGLLILVHVLPLSPAGQLAAGAVWTCILFFGAFRLMPQGITGEVAAVLHRAKLGRWLAALMLRPRLAASATD